MNCLPIQYSTYPSSSVLYVVKRITRVATVVRFLTVEPTDAAHLRELRLLKPRIRQSGFRPTAHIFMAMLLHSSRSFSSPRLKRRA